MRLSRRFMACLAAALFVAIGAAHAAAPQAAKLTPQDEQDMQRVQTYLNGIKTMESLFEQVAGDGQTATGMIFLARPGNMRIVYDPPSPILVVANSGQIHYYDQKLEQVSETYTADTPAWFLLRDNITLNGDVTVTRFAHEPNALRLTLVETKNPDQGEVTVVLSDHPLELRQWTVIDAQQKAVTVTLDNPRFGLPLSPQLFYWTKPEAPIFGK
jgi:outer membrane lipoprotein-sorting protein